MFYGCELYTGELRQGDPYANLPPVYGIWLIDGLLWPKSNQFHHAFRLTDAASGRVLDDTLAIHTIELPKYNTAYSDLASGDMLGQWLYWLRHAKDYEPEGLPAAFPQPAIRRASETLIRIAQISEDKAMYDRRERAIRDRQWELDSAEGKSKARRVDKGKVEGKIEGKIDTIRMLQGLLYLPLSDEQELRAMGLEQLELLASGLQEKLRSRKPS